MGKEIGVDDGELTFAGPPGSSILVQNAKTTRKENCPPIAVHRTYYKPMGDLPYISSEEGGGLIIHHELIMRIISFLYLYMNLR